MHFVGMDLAWGEKRPTGLAVLDDTGRLVHLSAQTTDDAIIEALDGFTDGDCLVAVDAPLIVTNATGNRPAEKALNRDFARFDAGAHPANTGKPEFSARPRGARIAERLDLDIDPGSTAARRAIEVYPHPATVAVFRLGRTLKYKNKPGRTFAQMQAELLRLTGLLDGLTSAATPMDLDVPVWHDLVAAIASATRKSQLRVAEDQVDAVVCAHVALLAARRPDEVTTYGDGETGYIVTPRLPEGHAPSTRPSTEEVPDPAPGDPVHRAV